MTFTAKFGDNPRNKILDFLGDHAGFDYTISELASKAEVSRPTVYAELEPLLKEDLVVETRRMGPSKLFGINTDNAIVQAVLSEDFAHARAEAEKQPAPLRTKRK